MFKKPAAQDKNLQKVYEATVIDATMTCPYCGSQNIIEGKDDKYLLTNRPRTRKFNLHRLRYSSARPHH
jgi:transposase-like protein